METPKPKLLFLHGSGTNAAIFRIQSRKLAFLLKGNFELIYLDAATPCPPGPGVLPFFEGCGPYLTWLDDRSPETEQAYYEGDAIQHLTDEVKKMGLVGVVGFSMGAKVAMEVVRRVEQAAAEKGGRSSVGIVVVVCGTAPFQGGEADEERERGYAESLEKGLVKAESVHLIGEDDPWKAESEKLVGFFGGDRRTVVRFKGAHHMPVDDAVNEQVARLILAAVGDM